MRRQYTNDEFIEAVKDSTCVAHVLRKLGLQPRGTNYKTVRNLISSLGLDTSHWKKYNPATGSRKSKIPSEELFSEGVYRSSDAVKNRLIKDGYVEYECAVCGISTWQNKFISLHLDHISGDSSDNRVCNLRLLCPNCHSQTDTYAGKKNKIIRTCDECGVQIKTNSPLCRSCASKKQERISWPPTEELIRMVEETSYVEVGKKLGVTDNAVKKRIKNHPVEMGQSRALPLC